jgi:protoporphyrinogen oxidase
MEESEFIILGAGIAGMSAASVLGDRAIVLEKGDRPGGLVKTECFDGYWFDHVIHLLYFEDSHTENHIRELLGDELKPCLPEVWVETESGTVRFPFQFHLGGLDKKAVLSCLMDLARLTYVPRGKGPANFEEMLLGTFGGSMCDIFFLPYNRKVWKRPLAELEPDGFVWNIQTGTLEKALRGALNPEMVFDGYNSRGWYPQPRKFAPLRGMEILSKRLASRVGDLRLNHAITEIDLDNKIVTAEHLGGSSYFKYTGRCVSTLPLNRVLEMCPQTPAAIRNSLQNLKRNRVRYVDLSMKGPRPVGTGHWRYYADESIIFTRLVYMHEFDPLSAPDDGWGVMAEVIERGEDPPCPDENLYKRVEEDLNRVGAIPRDSRIVGRNIVTTDPAYLVFSLESREIIDESRAFLEKNGVTLLGRYGRWAYNSMAQVLHDSFNWAGEISKSAQGATALPQ